MDADDEFVATIHGKDFLSTTTGRRSSDGLVKEPKRKSPNLRDSLGEAYVRKVADWLEAGGPRGSIEQMYLYNSEFDGNRKAENENSSHDAFDLTMYFDSTQTWDAAENALKSAQHIGNGIDGRMRRRSADSRMADKKADLTQDFTEELKFEDPPEHHDESNDSEEAKDGPKVLFISQPDINFETETDVRHLTVDQNSNLRTIRSPSPEVSTDASNHSNEPVESDTELMTEDYSRLLTKLCVRVHSDLEAIQKNPGELVVAVNAGSQSSSYSSSGIEYQRDQNFVGGDVLRTDEDIGETAEQALYQTARYGNISYKFSDFPCGDYFVDLHFAEIVFTNGPSGMRVFDVYIQGEKVISDLDVYGEVGSNKALILCAKTCVVNGSLNIAFEGVIGHPTISAICVRRAPFSGTIQAFQAAVKAEGTAKPEGHAFDDKDCVEPVEVEHKSRRQEAKNKARAKCIEYEAKLEALKNECHEAWISLQDSNRSIERLQNELVSKSVTIDALANVVEVQEAEMKCLRDKEEGMQRWKVALGNLYREMKVLKEDNAVLAREAKDLKTTFPEITNMTSPVQQLVTEHEELKKRYAEESLERRQLYNKVLELKGNIRVFCRCRPLSPAEVSGGASSVVEFDAVKDNELIVRTGNAKKLFKFDQVFTPQDDQGEVFANTAPVVISVLDGYNVCIFAYGQTGTGKTFTMEGTPDNRGVNYRTLEELFHVAEQRRTQFNYEISVSVLEVYNEQIRDLLAQPPELDQPVKKLEIRQVAEGGHHVPGLVEAPVHSMTQVWDVLQSGSSARAVESTNSNEHSSRSHCMLCVMVKGQNLITGECTRSKLWLVDLAGSERVAKSDVQGDRLREAQSINKSLSALGDVIAALTTKSSHIPFRNSKLTHLLQDSLGGDSKTLMFVQISPSEDDAGETLCSLNFASRVRGVELGQARKQIDSSELFKYKQLAERAKQEGRTKDEALKKVEDNLRNTEVKLKVKEHLYQAVLDKVKEKEKAVADLEANLAAERKARLAATTALKEKGSIQVEKVPLREGKVPPERVPERRPLLEKVQDFSEGTTARGLGSPRVASPGFSTAPVKEPAGKEKPHNENADPQHSEASEEAPQVKPARTKVVPSRYNSPTLGRKVVRKPMRASIASTYKINPATLTSSFSSDESGPEGVKENARLSNYVRDVHSTSLPRQNGTASTTAASGASQRRAVHFASPVFQRDKVGEVKQKEALPLQQQPPHQTRDTPERSMSLGGAADAKKLGVGKVRRVSIARTFGRFPPGTVGGAQRVLSTVATGAKTGTTTASQPQKERRWNK